MPWAAEREGECAGGVLNLESVVCDLLAALGSMTRTASVTKVDTLDLVVLKDHAVTTPFTGYDTPSIRSDVARTPLCRTQPRRAGAA